MLKIITKKQRGIVLVTVLIFMLVICLLVVLDLQTANLQRRMGSNMQQQDETFAAAQDILVNLYNNFNPAATKFNSLFCSNWQFIYADKSCWSNGDNIEYSGKRYEYRSVFNRLLTEDSSRTIDGISGVDFYRLTVMAQLSSFTAAKSIVQLTFAVADPAIVADKNAVMIAAWQSWQRM